MNHLLYDVRAVPRAGPGKWAAHPESAGSCFLKLLLDITLLSGVGA